MFKGVQSTRFLKELEDRASRMGGSNIGACLKVPIEHKWWYYQENGTVPGYPIFPVNKRALAWTDPDGSHHVVAYVHDHPGVKAKHFVLDSLPDIKLTVFAKIAPIVNQYDVLLMQSVLETEIMPAAKDIILNNVKTQLPGSRAAGSGKGESAGKLGGQTAAEVLDAVITIESI